MNKRNKMYFGLLILGILLVSSSYCLFIYNKEVNKQSNIVLKNFNNKLKINALNDSDIKINAKDVDILAWNYVGAKATPSSMPIKNSGYSIDKVECSNAEATWDSYKWEVSLKNITGKVECTVTFGDRYKEKILNGADPVLREGLIPVTISDNGTVTYADISEAWYSYENKIWANAVKLLPNKSYSVGQTISEADIESYFVWIPKYKYKLWNTGKTGDVQKKKNHLIEIEFGLDNTTNINGVSCETPMTAGNSGECNNGEYMTHPAFKSLNVKGFWVGKFETGYKGANSAADAQVNSDDSTKVIVKPDVYSWRSISVSNAFKVSYNYVKFGDNHYSHMMKNTEWGAVAYLSHSKYGIGKEVRINNNSSYKTGYSSLPSINQQAYVTTGLSGIGENYNQSYNTEVGYMASTTGNITGIYDMNGGASEYVAAYSALGSSGFDDSNKITDYESKYFDAYPSNSTTTGVGNRILGDATGEMGSFRNFRDGDNQERWHNSWYADYSYFLDSDVPWFNRSGKYDQGVLAGVFFFDRYTGGVSSNIGFRLVIG